MPRIWPTIIAGVAAVVAAACSASLSGVPTVRFSGEANDPAGDTAGIGRAGFPRPPDLIYASARVSDDAVRFTVRFAPGSFDPKTTAAMFLLDTDLDSTTGAPDLGVGVEYAVTLNAGSPVATIARATTDPGCSRPCRYEPFQEADAIISTDEMDVAVSPRVFERFDGRFNFRVIAFAYLDGGRQTITGDHLPNLPAQFVMVR